MKTPIVLFAAKSKHDKSKLLPLNLLSISRYLYDDFDIHIQVGIPGGNELEELLAKCKNAACVGFTCMTGSNISDCLCFADMVIEIAPEIPFVWGGFHPSITSKQCLKDHRVDFVVRGQGELTFRDMVHCINDSGKLSEVFGLSWKNNGEIIENPSRPYTKVNRFPPIPYHIVDLEEYIRISPKTGRRNLDYITSQGCPNNCLFCSSPVVYKRRWSGLDPAQMIEDMKRFQRDYNIGSLTIRDDNFFVNKHRVFELCELLLKENMDMKMVTVDGTAHDLSRYSADEFAVLKRAGLDEVYIGAESGDNESLDMLGKRCTAEDIFDVAVKCAGADMAATFSFIIGLPLKSDVITEDSVNKEIIANLSLMQKIEKLSPGLFFFTQGFWTPYPGNHLFDSILAKGFESPKTLEEWSYISRHSACVSLPKHLNLRRNVIEYALGLVSSSDDPWTGIKNIGRNIFRRFAKLRFRNNFFAFPFEYQIYSNMPS